MSPHRYQPTVCIYTIELDFKNIFRLRFKFGNIMIIDSRFGYSNVWPGSDAKTSFSRPDLSQTFSDLLGNCLHNILYNCNGMYFRQFRYHTASPN